MIIEPLVSVVVPTRNSARTLGRCLNSVRAQTYRNIEIIVVDNGSTDGTLDVARRYADVVLSGGPERSAQVNQGARSATGKYVYRIDSDFVLAPDVVEDAIQVCELDGNDAAIIHNTSDSTVGFWAKVRKLERDCYKGDRTNVAVRFIRRELFAQVGGFDEMLVAGEDYDLHNRLVAQGARLGWARSEECHIGEPRSLWEIARKHYYYGQTIRAFMKKWPGTAARQLSPLRNSFARRWRVFAAHPVLLGGFAIYQGTRYSAAALGYARAVIRGGRTPPLPRQDN